MSVPGFAAEASLYRSGMNYRAKAGVAAPFGVVPAAMVQSCQSQCGRNMLDCDRHCSISNDACRARCLQAAISCSNTCSMALSWLSLG